jgi:hypothetical protein
MHTSTTHTHTYTDTHTSTSTSTYTHTHIPTRAHLELRVCSRQQLLHVRRVRAVDAHRTHVAAPRPRHPHARVGERLPAAQRRAVTTREAEQRGAVEGHLVEQQLCHGQALFEAGEGLEEEEVDLAPGSRLVKHHRDACAVEVLGVEGCFIGEE